jgi:hypothetical protein
MLQFIQTMVVQFVVLELVVLPFINGLMVGSMEEQTIIIQSCCYFSDKSL